MDDRTVIYLTSFSQNIAGCTRIIPGYVCHEPGCREFQNARRKVRRAVSSVDTKILHFRFTPLLARTNIVGHAEPSINKVNCGRYSVNKKPRWILMCFNSRTSNRRYEFGQKRILTWRLYWTLDRGAAVGIHAGKPRPRITARKEAILTNKFF